MPVERAAGRTRLIDVLDRVLDEGIVIDAWVRASLVGTDLSTVEARVSKPALEGKGYEEVIAENAALRAQLQSAGAVRRAAGGRRRAVSRA